MKHLVIVALVLLSVSCKKKQPPLSELNKNCSEVKEVSAAFLLEEMTTTNTNFAKYTDTDSIFSSKGVRFTALETDAEYTWYIGSEIITTREVTRYFADNLVGQTIPITLVVKKKPNTICNPNDDGYDSIVRNIIVAQLPTYENLDTTFMEGVYRMKSTLLNDSVDIRIDYRNYSNNSNKRIDIYNYDGLGSNCLGIINRGGDVNYRQFWTYGETSIWQGDYLQGDVHNRLDNVVEMNFTTGGYINTEYITELKEYKYKGRKL